MSVGEARQQKSPLGGGLSFIAFALRLGKSMHPSGVHVSV